jgi:hypothetical protein
MTVNYNLLFAYIQRTPTEEATMSQLWNGTRDITYCPIANKICNVLTQQAGGVMSACNPLLDRFILTVLHRLYPNIDSDELSSHRRYCSLSIFTAGSRKAQCDGFANTPHFDKKDIFEKKFQNEAALLLSELKSMYNSNSAVMGELNYLETLSSFHRGFCVPTTCGYSIIPPNEGTSDVRNSHISIVSDFAMIGLGVSVTIIPKSYHYFMASLFTHCTPVPLFINDYEYVTMYSGQYNVVGWGGGKADTDNTYKRRKSKRILKKRQTT